MNKTLLLIIVDFLFLNLIALTRWERAEPPRPAPVLAVAARGTPTAEQDLVDTMRTALVREQEARQGLKERLAARDAALSERQQALERQRSRADALAGSLDAARQEQAGLSARLASAAREALEAREDLARARQDLDRREAEEAARRAALAALQRDQEASRRRIEDLLLASDRAEQARRLLAEETDRLRGEVDAERTERLAVEHTTSQLAQGVGQLAKSSGELTREIHDATPVSDNLLFEAEEANRVTLRWTTVRHGLFGDSERAVESAAAVVTAGGRLYALLEADATPFPDRDVPQDWVRTAVRVEGVGGVPAGDAGQVLFLTADPRVLAVPLDPGRAGALAARAYRIAADPFRFPEATLIERNGAGYGDLTFKLDPDHPGYVRVDNRLFKRLVGDFSPSRGDLVLSRRGELLGVMVSPSWCALVRTFEAPQVLELGPDEPNGRTQHVLDAVSARSAALPLELQ